MEKAVVSRSNKSFDGSTSNRFIELALEIKRLAAEVGCTVRPFHDGLPYFDSQTTEKKREILGAIQVFVDICKLTLVNGKRLDDTKSITWYGLSHLDMRFTSDLFSKITDGDILEVYTNDNVQIFRNFKFLELTSYTIEDIFCRPWTELFTRYDSEKSVETLAVMKKIATREINNTVSLEYLGAHKIEEALSPFKYQYDYTIKYLSPLYDKDYHPIGYIMIESAKILNPINSNLEKERLLTSYYDSALVTAQI